MTILVTGAAGTIGRATKAALLSTLKRAGDLLAAGTL
jgi:uncharacterized protein YbjT (DUF2867 family)